MGAKVFLALASWLVANAARAEDMPDGFVHLRAVAPEIAEDIRYAAAFNFTGQAVPGYESAECILTRSAATALSEVEHHLNRSGYGLVVFDCYRPRRAVLHFVQWAGSDADQALKPVFFPDVEKRELMARGYIASRSAHSRGSTVDVGLRRLSDAAPSPTTEAGRCDGPFERRPRDTSLDLGTSFDCFSPKSAMSSGGIGKGALENRNVLRDAMVRFGFRGYEREWWHYTLAKEPYPKTEFDFVIR